MVLRQDLGRKVRLVRASMLGRQRERIDYDKALFDACEAGNLTEARRALRAGANINVKDAQVPCAHPIFFALISPTGRDVPAACCRHRNHTGIIWITGSMVDSVTLASY